MIRKRRRAFLLTFAAVALLLSGPTALAACTEWDYTYGVPHYRQAKSNWCWAAVSLMILRYFHPDYGSNQSTLVGRSIGTTADVTGSPAYILDNPLLSDLEYDWSAGPIPYLTVLDNIGRQLPMQLDLLGGSGKPKHAVIVYGFHEIDCQYNGAIELLIWDPAGYSYRKSYDDLVAEGRWVGTRYNFRFRS